VSVKTFLTSLAISIRRFASGPYISATSVLWTGGPGGISATLIRAPYRSPIVAEPGADDKGDQQRKDHGRRSADRDGAHIGPHQAGDEGHRQERGDYGQGRQNGGIPHLGDGKDCGQRFDLVELKVAVDVFHHHDGVVNQDADREDQRNQDDHGDGGHHHVLQQFVGFLLGRVAIIPGHGDVHIAGDELALQRLHLRQGLSRDEAGVGPFFLGDGRSSRLLSDLPFLPADERKLRHILVLLDFAAKFCADPSEFIAGVAPSSGRPSGCC